MNNLQDIFGSMVFNDKVMESRLSAETYSALKKAIKSGESLDIDIAGPVASAMKEWAIEKGATHYTHWFQPMTGVTAEKHDSFISATSDNEMILEFSGKELIKGEPDASSFPSGGLRATFEARGYTAWDPTSYAFIKDSTLCIPTVFCSYGGEVLDRKTPLLKSISAIDAEALRIVKLFGMNDVTHVTPTVGPEQEYFLIDKSMYMKRKDLIFSGRTLFGAKPLKGQELGDHYFVAIKPNVQAYMRELDNELWKLGVFAKTEHNEAAPAQHELAPIFTNANLATDHNQLTMELMKNVAEKFGLVCLLHEKPFEGINGSGKHNNWSLQTDTGINLFKPGKNPENNKIFLLFLCAVIEAVDLHQDLLRMSVASAGNDHRLGAHEAPPAIVSMFLGDELSNVLYAIENGSTYASHSSVKMDTGVGALPRIKKDNADRNRTSPMAFTGNKFEFRMLGSAASVSSTNVVMNTIVADVLSKYADRLEKADDFDKELNSLMRNSLKEHKRIIYNGNSYSQDWIDEAQKRGLLNLVTAPDALPCLKSKDNIELFARHKVFTEAECISRCDVNLMSYSYMLRIEAYTMVDMVRKEIYPAVMSYINDLAGTAIALKNIDSSLSFNNGNGIIKKLTDHSELMINRTVELENALDYVPPRSETEHRALYFKDKIIPLMSALRETADELETMVSSKYWPFPTYSDMLYNY